MRRRSMGVHRNSYYFDTPPCEFSKITRLRFLEDLEEEEGKDHTVP